jgi:hypothetical protein
MQLSTVDPALRDVFQRGRYHFFPVAKAEEDLFLVYVSAFAQRRGEGATKAGNDAGKNT